MSRWQNTTVTEVAVKERGTVSGPFGSSISKKFFVDSGVPVIRGNNLSLGTNGPRFHDDDFVYLTNEKANELASAECRANDLVFTARGTIGQVGIIPGDCRFPRYILSANQLRLRPDVSIADPLYLYYWFSTPMMVAAMKSRNTGSALPNMNLGTLRTLPIALPPLPEQRRIAHILGTLDEKIELNRRMNATLESMARALFKSWFMDFQPVRAKMDESWSRGESLKGMPAELYELFPKRLVQSELGEMPEGWKVKAIEEIVNINPESWSRSNSPFEVKYVDLANTKWGTIQTIQHHLWEDAPSRARRILRPGDTVMGTVRPGNGSYALIGEEGLTGSTGFAVLRPSEERFREITYLACTSKENVEWLAHLADGGAYPAIRPEIVGQTRIVIPVCDGALVNCFSSFIAPLFAKATSNNIESSTTSALRDALLPRLVSGKANLGDG